MKQQRIAIYDNLKGFLVIAVVFIHVLMNNSFIQNNDFKVSEYLQGIISSFTMPTFIFISGLFTTKRQTYEDQAEKLVSDFLLPYVIFHLLWWALFSRSLIHVFDSGYHTWYLLCLFCWRIMVIPVSKIRFSILFSIAAALICGFTPAGSMLSISRTICFFRIFWPVTMQTKKRCSNSETAL